MGAANTWKVYLAGEIHSDWRQRIADGVTRAGLPVTLFAPVTDHPAGDGVGVELLGAEQQHFWKDTRERESTPSARRRCCTRPTSWWFASVSEGIASCERAPSSCPRTASERRG